jgi:hypothetical protein
MSYAIIGVRNLKTAGSFPTCSGASLASRKTKAMRHAFLISLCTLIFVGCQSSSEGSDPQAVILSQWSGARGGSDDASTLVVRSAGEWTALWRRIGREEPRKLDPAKEMAVAVFLGEKRTGGFSVEIKSVREESGNLFVEYHERTPAPDMVVAQVLTSPWTVAVTSRSSSPVVFVKASSRAGER